MSSWIQVLDTEDFLFITCFPSHHNQVLVVSVFRFLLNLEAKSGSSNEAFFHHAREIGITDSTGTLKINKRNMLHVNENVYDSPLLPLLFFFQNGKLSLHELMSENKCPLCKCVQTDNFYTSSTITPKLSGTSSCQDTSRYFTKGCTVKSAHGL